jgi:hypothetical protein
MKTMRQGSTIVRAEESQVNHYLRTGFQFCAKKEWKEEVRDVNRTTPAEKKSKKKARKAKN